jgi:hypothetical protein
MWVVFIDRPYYPSVEGEYATEAEASAAAHKLAAEEAAEDGKHDSKVYVAQVIKVLPIKTHF